MNHQRPHDAPDDRRFDWSGARLLAGCLGLLLISGCATGSRREATEGRLVQTQVAALPAQIVSNFFLVEAVQADGRPARFIIDTGSTANLVSIDLATRLGQRDRARARRTVQVRSANGGEVSLEQVTLRRLQLAAARFERVPALVFDFGDLSAHLGVRIDGLIGFPLFHDTRLTLEYLQARLVLTPHSIATSFPADPTASDSPLSFNNEQGTPLIPVQMGNESFVALVDSGSDGALNLNPAGLHPRFLFGPRSGTVVSSLAGDRRQLAGRLGQDVLIGSHTITQPIVDLTDQLSSIGGEILRHFNLTFDQRNNTVVFSRPVDGAVVMEPRRSTGLSLVRAPIYWRVMAVIEDSPSTHLGVRAGDLIVRINGEPVDRWGLDRYATLLASAAKVTYTFLAGTREFDLEIPVFELVP
ncbi:MAG: aspartyl protease family protein [Candidatus Didemnitutus sp.]|nr:aspartyl protease family protein [Candidatus Didemnitutus sp.]